MGNLSQAKTGAQSLELHAFTFIPCRRKATHPAGLSRTMLTVLFLLQVLTWTGEPFFRDRFLRGRTKRSDNKDGKESWVRRSCTTVS